MVLETAALAETSLRAAELEPDDMKVPFIVTTSAWAPHLCASRVSA